MCRPRGASGEDSRRARLQRREGDSSGERRWVREREFAPIEPSGRRGVKKAWTALAGGVFAAIEGEGRNSLAKGEEAMFACVKSARSSRTKE